MTSYQEQTHSHKSWVKRYSHKKRFKIAIELLQLRHKDRLLDFGAADGYLTDTILSCAGIDLSITCYEPDVTLFRELSGRVAHLHNVSAHNTLDGLRSQTFNKIACLEVLEHLSREDQLSVLRQIKNLLDQKGLIVVSVPIEIGPSSLIKNTFRALHHEYQENMQASNVVRSLLGMRITRTSQKAYFPTHTGFDFRDLEQLFINARLTITRKCFSPLPLLGKALNSQIIYLLEPL
jgi:2-polyprenyl-3-methyl-5-hydroxy-6-metoxy-1,4-benzoquinol methylase